MGLLTEENVSTPKKTKKTQSRRWLSHAFPHLAFAVVLFGSWEVYGQLADVLYLPPVSAILAALVEIIIDATLVVALAESLQLLVIGFASALAISFVLGVLIGRYRLFDRTVSPFMNALYATPDVALIPIILVWFGFGMPGRITVVFLSCFFPMLINFYTGIREAPRDLQEVARSFGCHGQLSLLVRIVIPSATPYLLSGIRLGIGRAIVGMALAEVYLRLSGIGALITTYGSSFQMAHLFAAILPLPILGIVLTKMVQYFENRIPAAQS